MTWAAPSDAGDPAKVSRVTFDVSTFRDSVKLTVSHEELEPESEMLRGVSMGWPAVLSSLKSLLETGLPVPGTDQRWHE